MTDFEASFNKIIPCTNIEELINEWYNNKSIIRDKELFDFFNKFDYKKGLGYLMQEAFKRFDNSIEYPEEFLSIRVKEHYIITYLRPKLDKYLLKINDSISSKEWIDKFSRQIYRQTPEISSLIRSEIKKYYKENIFDTKLNNIVSGLDFSKGSKVLNKELLNKLMGDIENFNTEISNVFGRKYIEEHLDNVIDKYLETVNPNYNSIMLVNECKELNYEDGEFYNYFIARINEWYRNTHEMENKILEILDQFIITLGPRNWEVRWIGHGLLTEDKIYSAFREHDFHKSFIMSIYNKWYNMAVMLATEKHMGNINF